MLSWYLMHLSKSQTEIISPDFFSARCVNGRISAPYAVVRYLSVTFVYCVETAKVTVTVAMECE